MLGSRDVAGGAIAIAGRSARGSYRYLARLAFADAHRNDRWVVLQRQVDDAALVWRHRLQRDAAAGGADAGSGALGQANQRFFAAAAVAVHIDREGDAAIGRLANYQINEILQRSQRLPTAADQQTQVLAF